MLFWTACSPRIPWREQRPVWPTLPEAFLIDINSKSYSVNKSIPLPSANGWAVWPLTVYMQCILCIVYHTCATLDSSDWRLQSGTQRRALLAFQSIRAKLIISNEGVNPVIPTAQSASKHSERIIRWGVPTEDFQRRRVKLKLSTVASSLLRGVRNVRCIAEALTLQSTSKVFHNFHSHFFYWKSYISSEESSVIDDIAMPSFGEDLPDFFPLLADNAGSVTV